MANTYLNFITDEHLLKCIASLHRSYVKTKNDINKPKFYNNKIDTIKLTFDSKFNGIDQEELIDAELLRQIDKSINNFIGTFHEDILGGVVGYEKGNLSGFDIKATDNTLFADIKNKHNTMNSSSAESLFQKLSNYADRYRNEQAKCYWAQILAKGSFNEKWKAIINGKEYSHSRVFKISGDQFYALVTQQSDALFQLYKVLPQAIENYMHTAVQVQNVQEHSAVSHIKSQAEVSGRTILDQITLDNFGYYLGFGRL
ncbi:Eco47II family restriction endonuclease [Mucilaginibacter sp.]